jgi:NADH-quinone oxidoreductase subunit F
LRPPFPANKGLFGKPTVINNVETLANVPFIVARGADWYLSLGNSQSPGPKIFCLSGHSGGVVGGGVAKGILPAGASAPMLPATDNVLDMPLDYESLKPLGSSLGSASVIILDETVDIFHAAHKMVRFFKHESCGKCTPCREGTYWMLKIYDRIAAGIGSPSDLLTLEDVAHQMQGKCLCALGEFAVSPVLSTLEHFRQEYKTRMS